MQRRTLLRLGLASSALLLVAGGGAALWRPGLERGLLGPGGRAVFRATARAVLDTTLPPEHAAQQAAIGQLLQRIDILIGALHPYSRAELSQLLSLLDSAAGRRVLAGLDTPWQDASTVDVQHALQGMRLSSLALRRQAYAALHDITSGAYFSDPSSWPVLGYPGPLKI